MPLPVDRQTQDHHTETPYDLPEAIQSEKTPNTSDQHEFNVPMPLPSIALELVETLVNTSNGYTRR